jgi:hypothetical protein
MKMPSFIICIRKYIKQQKFPYLFVSSKSIRDANLQQQRQSASKEASYIKSLSYWPIAKTEVLAESHALVYLHINKVSRHAQYSKTPHLHSSIVSLFEFRLKKR